MTAVRQTLWKYTPLFLLAAAWEISTQANIVAPNVLPTLSSVLVTFFAMLKGDLGYHTMLSLARGAAGLGAAIVVGVSVGILMAWYRPFRRVFKPFIQLFYPLPKSAMIPVAIIWLGLGSVSKIALIFIGSLLPVVVSAYNAARSVDHLLIWSARSAGAREPAILWEIVLPAASGEILNGIRIALGLSFILIVSGEFVFANDGIGFLISFLGEIGNYRGMFAAVLAISLVGFVADRAMVLIGRRLLAWQD